MLSFRADTPEILLCVHLEDLLCEHPERKARAAMLAPLRVCVR